MPDGRIILVTGANRGIGKEICRQLLLLGQRPVMTGRDHKALLRCQDELDPSAERSVVIDLDVRSAESIQDAVRQFRRHFDRLDGLINNAGILGTSDGLTLAEWPETEALLETNVLGPLRLIRAFLPLLRKGQEACIVNLSSVMGASDSLHADYGPYRFSKYAINGMTCQLADELREESIAVHAVCPGWVRTDMGGSSAPRSVQRGAETPVWLAVTSGLATGKFWRDKAIIPW
jgi:NAD(P)-dependent dehydrogenase (short-subunit alcohol dehydrogenase family)